MADAKARTERATGQAQRYWRRLYGDHELLLSVPGMAPVTASVIRGFLADGSAFTSGKAAASYVRLNPSTWSSGTVSQPSRAITKEGPAVLRLAYFQAANAARAGSATGRVLPPADDRTRSLPHPGLRGGRPQTGRTDLDSAQPRHPYQIRDLDGQPISRLEAKKMIKQVCTVPTRSGQRLGRTAQPRIEPDPLSTGGHTLPML
jgi:hypothetical protein